MLRRVIFASILALLAVTAVAQTTTSYDIPTGTLCYSGGIEHCTFHPVGIVNNGFGRFQTGDPWTQLVFDASHADYCTNFQNNTTTAVWNVSDTTLTPPPLPTPVYPILSYTNQSDVKLYVMDCVATAINTSPVVHPQLHAEIYAYSYVKTYVLRGGTRHEIDWAVADGSFVEETK